jgi:hypothetical protein
VESPREEKISPRSAIIVAVAFAFILVLVFIVILWMTSAPDPVDTNRLRLQVISPLFILFYFANTTVVIPDSYDLVLEMGGGATVSGWLVASAWPLQAVALCFLFVMKSWSWRVQRAWVLVSMLVLCMSSLLYAAAADPPHSWKNSKDMLWLSVARVSIGPNLIFGTFLRIAAQQVTLPSENVTWNMVISLAVTLGTGLGPIVSPVVAWCIGADAVRHRSAASAYAFALLWVFMFLFSIVFVPNDLKALVEQVKLRRQNDERQRNQEVAEMPEKQRRSIWWSGVWFTAERSFIIAALEAATVFVLENEFGWSAPMGGFAVGSSFLSTLPLTLVLMHIKSKSIASDTSLLQVVVVTGALMTIMFFPIPGVGMGIAATLLLVTDCIVFATGFAADGLMNGFATNHCEGVESFFSTSNYIMATQFIRVVPRALSPIVSRYLLSVHGRAMYAGVQLIMSTFGCMTCFHVAATIQANREVKASGKEGMQTPRKQASATEGMLTSTHGVIKGS